MHFWIFSCFTHTGDFKFVSATYRLFKVPKGNTNPSKVIYQGNITGVEENFQFDYHYTFKVCRSCCTRTAQCLQLIHWKQMMWDVGAFHRPMRWWRLMESWPPSWPIPGLKRTSPASHQEHAVAAPVESKRSVSHLSSSVCYHFVLCATPRETH